MERAIPALPSGGTRAAAIATPGKAAVASVLHKAYATAIPEASATPKSSNVGCVLDRTCWVNGSLRGRRPIKRPINRARKEPRATAPRVRRKKRVSPSTMARPVPAMGDIKGATSMAPITTAAELASNPNAAMAAARPIKTKKSVSGLAPRRIRTYDSVRSWRLSLGTTSRRAQLTSRNRLPKRPAGS